jgi:exopolysaccharide biosynthesis polyprenyl glycosylphosphotransferase
MLKPGAPHDAEAGKAQRRKGMRERDVSKGIPGTTPRRCHRDSLRRRMLCAADGIGVLVAAAVTEVVEPSVGAWATVLTLPLWVLLAKVYGLYDQDHRSLRHLTIDEFPAHVAWSATGTASFAVLLLAFDAGPRSASATFFFWLVVTLLVPVLRASTRAVWRSIVPPERTLIVGSGALEVATRRKLELFSDIHVDCVGTFDHDAVAAREGADAASRELAERITRDGRLERIIVASGSVDEPLIAQHVALCRLHGLKLSIVPPARGMFGTAVQLNHIAELPLIEYSTSEPTRSSRQLKRGLDIVLSAVLLILALPLLLLIAVAVRVSSPGRVIFAQDRAGVDGKPFRMFKFRTMYRDAEDRLVELIDVDGLPEPVFKLRDDPRVTPVGRILRRYSLDELPQLWNVLRGEMSLVGPRPEELQLVKRYLPEQRRRLAIKPGLTGPMQVYGRGDLSFDERLAVEREYLENSSVARDVHLLLLTIPAVIRGRGAY